MGREACDFHLVVDRPNFTFSDFSLAQLVEKFGGLPVDRSTLFSEFGNSPRYAKQLE